MKILIIMMCYLLLVVAPAEVFAQDNHDTKNDQKQIDQDQHEDHDDHNEHEDHDEGESDHDEHDDDDEDSAHDEHGDHDDEKTFVEMTAKELKEFGIELRFAASGIILNEIVVPGEIAVNGNKLAHITPRFTGMITEVRINIGDKVRRGDILAVVESNESLTSYNVTSLIDGKVIEKHATIGEVLTEDQPAFLVANLDTVWVNLSIYQMHLPIVRIGQQVNIALGHGQESQKGTISYISPLVDEHTRTATARVVLDNRSGNWRPGLLIEGVIATESSEAAIVIPKTALHQLDESDVVFVKTDKGFEPQPIVLGRTNHSTVEVIRGLTAGQQYVSKGGFTLKAEMQKGSFGDGHGH